MHPEKRKKDNLWGITTMGYNQRKVTSPLSQLKSRGQLYCVNILLRFHSYHTALLFYWHTTTLFIFKLRKKLSFKTWKHKSQLFFFFFFLSLSQSIPVFYYHSWTKHISAITPLPEAVLRPLELTLWNISREVMQVQALANVQQQVSNQARILKGSLYYMLLTGWN